MHLQKNYLIGAGVAAGLYLLMPQERLDRATEAWRRVTGNAGQLCLDYERAGLKDPDSARLLSSDGGNESVTIKYKAKNSYGAYGTREVVCVVAERAVDDIRTATVRLKRQNDCMEQALALQKDSFGKSEAVFAQSRKAFEKCKALD